MVSKIGDTNSMKFDKSNLFFEGHLVRDVDSDNLKPDEMQSDEVTLEEVNDELVELEINNITKVSSRIEDIRFELNRLEETLENLNDYKTFLQDKSWELEQKEIEDTKEEE